MRKPAVPTRRKRCAVLPARNRDNEAGELANQGAQTGGVGQATQRQAVLWRQAQRGRPKTAAQNNQAAQKYARLARHIDVFAETLKNREATHG